MVFVLWKNNRGQAWKRCQLAMRVQNPEFDLGGSVQVPTLGVLAQIQRPKSEACRGELFFQDSRCARETTRCYGAN